MKIVWRSLEPLFQSSVALWHASCNPWQVGYQNLQTGEVPLKKYHANISMYQRSPEGIL